MKTTFKIGFTVALLLALTGSTARAADPTVASVDMTDVIRKDGRPSTTAGGMVRDPLFNAEVFVRATLQGAVRGRPIPGLDATQSGLNQLRDDWVAGRPPVKVLIPVGTVTYNYYVILPSGSRVAQVRRRSNRSDGRYAIPAGESRWVTSVDGMTMSIGTCCNYLPIPVVKIEYRPAPRPLPEPIPVPEPERPCPPPVPVKVPCPAPIPVPEKPCPPPPPPVFRVEVVEPEPPIILPQPQAQKSGYFPGHPSEEVQRYQAGGFGAFGTTDSGRTIVRGRRQTVGGGGRGRGGPPPPPGGGKTRDTGGNRGGNAGGDGRRGID